jgi:hypothetical protein
MATSLEQFGRELRGFRDRKVILRELRVGIRKPLPAVRKRIKERAVSTLPSGGGLGKWAASTRVSLTTRFTGRKAGVTVKGGRNSSGGRSDLRALDRGRVRHPSWGKRGQGEWHTQTVPSGFFTDPVAEATEWREEIVNAVDRATEQIRRG